MGDYEGSEYQLNDQIDWTKFEDTMIDWCGQCGNVLRDCECRDFEESNPVIANETTGMFAIIMVSILGWLLLGGVVALLGWLTQVQYGTVMSDVPGSVNHRTDNLWAGMAIDLGEIVFFILSVVWVLVTFFGPFAWWDTYQLRKRR